MLKGCSYCSICSACDSCFIHAFLWNCSHGAMCLDAICSVLTLESHITITQNRYGTDSCMTSHTSMHHTQSKLHCVNSVINNHTIQFLYLKNRGHTLGRVNEPLKGCSHSIIVTAIYFSQLMRCMRFSFVVLTAPCELLHWIPYNPFDEIRKSQSKSYHENNP